MQWGMEGEKMLKLKRKGAGIMVSDFTAEQWFEEQLMQWGMKGEKMLKPKSKGAGIMASDLLMNTVVFSPV